MGWACGRSAGGSTYTGTISRVSALRSIVVRVTVTAFLLLGQICGDGRGCLIASIAFRGRLRRRLSVRYGRTAKRGGQLLG